MKNSGNGSSSKYVDYRIFVKSKICCSAHLAVICGSRSQWEPVGVSGSQSGSQWESVGVIVGVSGSQSNSMGCPAVATTKYGRYFRKKNKVTSALCGLLRPKPLV